MSRLTDQQRADVRELAAQGHPTAALAEIFGVSRRTIQNTVQDGRAVTADEVAAARAAYRGIAAERGERLPATDAEADALLDEIYFGGDPEFDPFGQRADLDPEFARRRERAADATPGHGAAVN